MAIFCGNDGQRHCYLAHGRGLVKAVGVALLVAFIAGAIFLLGQLMYAQLVLMPRQMASGSDVLAVTVDIWWALPVAAAAFVVYLTWRIWPKRQPEKSAR